MRVPADSWQYRYRCTLYRYPVRHIGRVVISASDERYAPRDFHVGFPPERRDLPYVHDFRKLLVWQLARELGADVYKLCRGRPRDELVVTSQLKRSAFAIGTNIAEGCGKSPRPEVIRYLDIAAGSAAETEHHLVTWQDIGGIDARECERLLARTTSIRRMLYSLMRNLPE